MDWFYSRVHRTERVKAGRTGEEKREEKRRERKKERKKTERETERDRGGVGE